jgi:hypothetical protein
MADMPTSHGGSDLLTNTIRAKQVGIKGGNMQKRKNRTNWVSSSKQKSRLSAGFSAH